MTTQKSKTPIIILIVVLILAGVAYFYYTGTPKDTSASLTTTAQNSAAAAEGAKVLALLNQISSLQIDTSLFTSPVYQSLVDHTVQVIPQNVGRPNPFASLFGSIVPASPDTGGFAPAPTAPVAPVKKSK